MNYYNEFDKGAAQWLRNLIAAKLIPDGVVDERSIKDVDPSDLLGFTQCHFFAGIGGWSYALQLAGWPADRPVWTGSCPCQPYSAAGRQKGDADERNLWPAFFRLIRECRPLEVFGEQVESAIGYGWLDGVSTDLEGEGYACGAVVLGAHSVGAPHQRQRLYWMAHHNSERPQPISGPEHQDQQQNTEPRRRLVDGERAGLEGYAGHGDQGSEPRRVEADPHGPAAAAGSWSNYEWLQFRDNKSRRIKPGIEPLADGIPRKLDAGIAGMGREGIALARTNRKAQLMGYGNAIVPQVAAEFIAAYLEA